MNDELKLWINENCFAENGYAHPFINRENWWKKKDLSKREEIISKTDFLNNVSIVQRIWHILNNVFHPSQCKNCDKETNFITLREGYRDFCSIKCQTSFNSAKIQEKRQKTIIERYGSLSNCDRTKKEIIEVQVNSDELVHWIKESCFSARGLNSRISIETWWKNKSKVLNLIFDQTEFLSLDRSSKTLPQRLWHLVNEITLIPVCKVCGSSVNFESFIKGYREHCSIFCVTQSEERNKKISENPNHKIGVEKAKQTCLERYGVDSPFKLESFQERAREGKLEKYGVLNVNTEKAKQTCLERYGVEYYYQSEDFREKSKKTKLERYGHLGIVNSITFSQAEEDVRSFLKTLGFDFVRSYEQLQTLELDGYCEELNLAFEYCGLYWHSDEHKKPGYHRLKYDMCNELDIRLITIFEDEWLHKPDLVKGLLSDAVGKYDKIIDVNECEVREIFDKNEAIKFFDETHIHGFSESATRYFGLFHGKNLIGGLASGRNYSNSNDIILNRLNLKPQIYVESGLHKLVEESLKMLNVNRGYVWSDNRWSNGEEYSSIGFKKEYDHKIEFTYIDKSKQERIQKNSIEDDVKDCFRIFDCGKIRWVFDI